MNTEERERINTLIDIALLMAQELTEFVDEAREASGDDGALASVQALLLDCEQAHAVCILIEEARATTLSLPPMPKKLHPYTAELVRDFSAALAAKLHRATGVRP